MTARSWRTLALGTLRERYRRWIGGLEERSGEGWVFPQQQDGKRPLWTKSPASSPPRTPYHEIEEHLPANSQQTANRSNAGIARSTSTSTAYGGSRRQIHRPGPPSPAGLLALAQSYR